MANLTELSQWENVIRQIENGEAATGGADGLANVQAKQLANRTQYLKSQIGNITNGTTPANKAVNDGSGRNIANTYCEKIIQSLNQVAPNAKEGTWVWNFNAKTNSYLLSVATNYYCKSNGAVGKRTYLGVLNKNAKTLTEVANVVDISTLSVNQNIGVKWGEDDLSGVITLSVSGANYNIDSVYIIVNLIALGL